MAILHETASGVRNGATSGLRRVLSPARGERARDRKRRRAL
jgi:hypothetical protein